MSSEPAIDYVRQQLSNHVRLFFVESVVDLFKSEAVRFSSYADCAAAKANQVVVPTDISIPESPESVWRVPFNDTELTLWNRLPKPSGDGWSVLPDDSSPVWYRHTAGTLMPAWNLFGNVFDLLTFGEEQRSGKRDTHGRFDWRHIPRAELGLLTVPAVNEAAALLVDAVVSLSRSEPPRFALDTLSGSPVVVLSHDCDLLAGNDLTTQAIRFYRIFQPLLRARLPRPGNLWWITRNAVAPHQFYFENATGMIDIERCFGFNSTFYLLNGSGGRFGARSSLAESSRLARQVPGSWETGIHYNYDTFLNEEKFGEQTAELQKVAPRPIVSGRAHYLRFDPFQSFSFLRQFGIYVDESSGWPDKVGFRNGLAGCFQAFDRDAGKPLDIWEVPMTVMDDALVDEYGSSATEVVEQFLRHLSRIGGALTVLFHPGQFLNPEHPKTRGIYHEILKVCRRFETRALTARELVDRIRR